MFVGGFVIFVGILLKLGGYGIMWMMIVLFYCLEWFGILVIIFFVFGSVFGVIICVC